MAFNSKALSRKEKEFCKYIIKGSPIGEAGIKAGFKNVKSGSNLHCKSHIKLYLRQLQDQRIINVSATAERVVEELSGIAFSNVANLHIDWDALKTWEAIPEEHKRIISSIKITNTVGPFGTKTTTEVKMHDKVKALDMLSKHLGLYERNNSQKKMPTLILNLAEKMVDVPHSEE